jgi:hypothetical protein
MVFGGQWRAWGGDIYGNGDGEFDVKDSTGAKFYTRFYHGRWMRG